LILKKIGEEATEVILAAKRGSKKELISEVADLFFHLLVTLEFCGVELDDVFEELLKREGISGIDEKNSRLPFK
jgi:phosphoribosyl-ATP pyrophosphohydrolase